MTREASQVLVVGDKAIEDWLRDRFGIDTDKVYIRNRISVGLPARLRVRHASNGRDDSHGYGRKEVA